MSETINLLPKRGSNWSIHESDDVDRLLISDEVGLQDLDLERILGVREHPDACRDFELLGEGFQGRVFGIGKYAVKFLGVRERYGNGAYGNFNQKEPLNQTRISEGIRVGLSHLRRTPATTVPRHYAFAEWTATYGSWRKALMIMDRVNVDIDSPKIADKEVTKLVRKEASRALGKVGISPKAVYWYDLENNILMSNGFPVVIDILPVDRFLWHYPLEK